MVSLPPPFYLWKGKYSLVGVQAGVRLYECSEREFTTKLASKPWLAADVAGLI